MKKLKNVNLDVKPLESVTIGEIKQNKFAWLKLLLIVSILGAIVFFLPEIQNLYNEYIVGNVSPSVPVVPNVPTKPEENTPPEENEKPEEKVNPVKFSDTSTFEYEGLTFENISYQNNMLSFVIKNNTEESINIPNDLYFELYNNDTYVRRMVISSSLLVAGGTKNNFQVVGKAANAFVIRTIKEQDYPLFDVSINEEGISKVVCTKGQETLEYTFSDDKLTSLKDTIKVSNASSSYDEMYSNYMTLVSEHQTNGVDASIETTSDGFTYNVNLDYGQNTSSVVNLYYFEKDAQLQKIFFKMDANLFNCK